MRDVAVAAPGPGQLLVRTTVSAVSPGTDGWVIANRFTWMPTVFPCIPGYQRAGVVVAAGPGVEGWHIGDRVVATIGLRHDDVGCQWGGHAALTICVAADTYRVPDGVDDVDAAHLVVAQVGWNAASRPHILPEAWVAVIGDGVIGLFAAQAARARGARVIVVGRRPARLAVAEHLGCAVVDACAGATAAAIRDIAGGAVRAVIDTVQGCEAQAQWLEALEPRFGEVVYSGFTPAPTWADMGALQQRELTAHFVSGWTRERMDAALAAIASGQLSARALVTDRVAAARAPEMLARVAAKDPAVLGIALTW